MKILHINSYYSDSALYKNLYDRQIEQGNDLNVFVSVPTNYEMPSREFGEYTLLRFNHRKWDRVWYGLKQKKMLNDLEKHYEVLHYDLIHAHSLFTNGGLAYQLYKKYQIPYLVAVRSTDINSFFKKMPHLRSYGIRIMENASKIIFISDSHKNELMEKYIPENKKDGLMKKSVTIFNGIDQTWLKHRSEKKEDVKDKDTLNIIYVGKIEKRKNVPKIAEACDILIDRGYSVKLTVIGKVLSQQEFDKFKNKNYLTYIPFQSMDKIREIYQDQDIFVMPSLQETFGLVYAEAMSQGLPVIYTKGQGFDGQFPEGTVGYHVDPHHAEEIADKILLICKNYQEISQNSVEKSARYDWDEIMNRYLEIYKNIFTK